MEPWTKALLDERKPMIKRWISGWKILFAVNLLLWMSAWVSSMLDAFLMAVIWMYGTICMALLEFVTALLAFFSGYRRLGWLIFALTLLLLSLEYGIFFIPGN